MPARTLMVAVGAAVGVLALFGILIALGATQQRRITAGAPVPTEAAEPSAGPEPPAETPQGPGAPAASVPTAAAAATAAPAAPTRAPAAPTRAPAAPTRAPEPRAEAPAAFDDFSMPSSGWAPLYLDDAGQYNGYSAGAYAFSVPRGTQPVYDVRAPFPFTPTHYAAELRILRGAGEIGLMIGVRGSPVDFMSLGYTRIGVSSRGQLVVSAKEPGRDERTLATSDLPGLALIGGAGEAIPIEIALEGDSAQISAGGSPPLIVSGIRATAQIGLYVRSAGEAFEAEGDNVLATAADPGRAGPACATLRDLFLTPNPGDYLEGADVRLAQQRLVQLGYSPEDVDGVYGPNTALALRDFQELNGLGEPWLGAETWCRLLGGQAITRTDGLTDRQHTRALHRQIALDPATPSVGPVLVSVRQNDQTWRVGLLLPGHTTLQYIETQGDALDPALSPDRSRLAFTSWRGGRSGGQIWLLDLADGTLRPISDPQLDCQFPSWSPDGTALMYTADQPGATGPLARNYIYRLSSDSSARWLDEHAGWSDWSSRNEIVFTRQTGRSYDLFRANPDGSGLVNLTNTDDADEDIAAWSPDGRLIAFVRNSHADRGDRQVMLMDRDGAGVRQLTSLPGPSSNPTWLPDGQWLLFANQPGTETWQPWMLNLATGALVRVADNLDRIWFMSGVRPSL